MARSLRNDLKQLVHPFMFVLKEGSDFKNNSLDYQLMILQMSCSETLRSPAVTGGAHGTHGTYNSIRPSRRGNRVAQL